MTSEEVVRARTGNDVIVTPWDGPKLAGFDLFFVRTKSRSDEPATGSGMVVNAGKILSGPDAMRAVIATGSQDAHTLAVYASYLLQEAALPLVDGAGVTVVPAEKALIKPPSLVGTTLEFWTYQPPISAQRLLHTRLDLGSRAIASTPAERLASPALDAVETARAKPAASAFDQRKGADELGKLCADPRVARDPRERAGDPQGARHARGGGQGEAGCKDAASVKALIAALGDAEVPVRKWAAESLGAIGDRSARPALEKLAKTEQQPDAQVSISRALES